MATLISAYQLAKSFAARPLFNNITFTINDGERIGLIGPNGAGKSTLLKILAGLEAVDSGTLSVSRGTRVGYLEQLPTFSENATIFSTIFEGAQSNRALEEDWEKLAIVDEYISKLSLNENGMNGETLVDQLSGGWKKRVALARELVKQPHLLLLDEPTNHLDVESIIWLEEFIANANFTVLTITHDRLFLQKIANRILELDKRNENGLLSINGDYATYCETKEQLIQAQERREIILKNTLRRETEWLRRGAKARTTKQQARITRAGELKDQVSELGTRNEFRTARIEFATTENNPKKLIEAESLTKSYEHKTLFRNFSIIVSPKTRLGILGANGCGKSTLIRVLLGQEKPDSGKINLAEKISISYFEQNRETLDPDLTLVETLCPRGDYVEFRNSRVHIRSYLDRFLFTAAQMDMRVANLSGGEQSRLLIAKLMLQTCNILVLDEPTNDLDMATLSVLEECLAEFNGAVILVTHDRYFLDQVASQIIAFSPKPDGNLVSFANLEQWEVWHQNQLNLLNQKPITKSANKNEPENKKQKLSYNEQREYDTIESVIHQTENELNSLTAESQKPENISNVKKLTELTQKMTKLQNEIERLYNRWHELEAYVK